MAEIPKGDIYGAFIIIFIIITLFKMEERFVLQQMGTFFKYYWKTLILF